MNYRILLLGGGTGGHVFPLIAVAQSLRIQAVNQGVDLDLRVMGEGQFLSHSANQNGLRFYPVASAKWRRYFSLLNFLDILKIPLITVQSLIYLWLIMPDVIFSKGGHAALIPALVAKILMIPIVTHESDAVPGLANKIIGRFSEKVFISFDSAGPYFKADKTRLVGAPIRREFLETNLTPQEAKQKFKLGLNLPVVFVMGGSQGAQRINSTILKIIVPLTQKFSVIHQVGGSNKEEVSGRLEALKNEVTQEQAKAISENYRLVGFLDPQAMAEAYQASDIVITRAGAGSLFEIANLGRPMIVVPLPNSAGDHQRANARAISRFGAIVLEESNFTPHVLLDQLEGALENSEIISAKIKRFANPKAGEIIARYLLSAV
ncbi:MAG: hypothetical protein COV31_00930 [Candidatus Yanofskybacteria bacterium CG10_big_fil_rev_8_21_14_0_10_46_23]|uniref:UDP-N-acetylglucosamine--N-acetylmuramyl-(pentapeptide) pyrophosphoryl-undecaprenol N-acetylglucosamine transferase n=1 Tax=Candidatus Yanofskybacteria bacterium CG10_big_fil_rev_8_21_14_0_10_46_23 TaxID=1975098 RepID=A0A2H0R4G6_9BACT|nr:MAG: hypothetical protein COV31_00930 [Candidatus Yanofskybacteria bacterium CG10_big_fil_rev_8_21_14_0_10_46_23]